MFDVGLPEIMVILVVAIIAFGPDKLPEYARQAGRMVRQLRQFAQSAQEDLRNELGPEYADLNLADLNPRAMIRKHVLDPIQDDLTLEQLGGPVLAKDERPPYDLEAT